jgi:type II secretory pathway pseudopilin PulG
MNPRVRPPRPGFTLFQLLLVLALLAFLFALFLPTVLKIRAAAARSQSGNNLRQIAIAMHSCNDAYNALPPLAGPFPAQTPSRGTVFFYLLPFVEQDNVYKNGFDGQGYSVWVNNTYATVIPTYLNPLDPTGEPTHRSAGGLALGSYAANFQVFGDPTQNTFQGAARIPVTFTDGTSNTIVFAERYQQCKGTPNAWGYDGTSAWAPAFAWASTGRFQLRPTDTECDPDVPQGPDPDFFTVALADGSARTLTARLTGTTWWAALTPNGGEILGADW